MLENIEHVCMSGTNRVWKVEQTFSRDLIVKFCVNLNITLTAYTFSHRMVNKTMRLTIAWNESNENDRKNIHNINTAA